MQIELALPKLLLHISRHDPSLDAPNAVEFVDSVNGDRQDLALDFARPFRLLLFVLDPKFDLLFQRILLGSIIEQERYGFVFLSGLGFPRRNRFILAEQLDSQFETK